MEMLVWVVTKNTTKKLSCIKKCHFCGYVHLMCAILLANMQILFAPHLPVCIQNA